MKKDAANQTILWFLACTDSIKLCELLLLKKKKKVFHSRMHRRFIWGAVSCYNFSKIVRVAVSYL